MKLNRLFALAAALLALPLAAQAAEPLRIGVSAGPYAEILEFAGKIYKEREGIEVKITEFPDYTMPNAALAQGDLDVNNFQHKPYLENQIKTRGYDLVPVEKSIVVPLGLYSKKVKSLAELKDGATVAIPNDPSNGARALILLQQAGVLTIDPKAGISATPLDVTHNPKKLKIKEIDAAQLPRPPDFGWGEVGRGQIRPAAGLITPPGRSPGKGGFPGASAPPAPPARPRRGSTRHAPSRHG
jgi:D-methionine transport system substrate-binding protein